MDLKSKKPRVIAVMPAYNAEKTLKKTLDDIPKDVVDEIILVDDVSRDNTVEVAEKIGRESDWLALSGEGAEKTDTGRRKVILTVRKHEANKGYGGNQKTCYALALERGADIVVMVHPDYQYDPKLIRHFVDFISEGYFDVMLGSRVRSRRETLAGGMPAYKYFANRALTLFENLASDQNLSEWHTGMRAYHRRVFEAIDSSRFSDDFIFDTQMLFAVVEKNFKIGDIPVPVRYFKEASSINFARSVRYGLLTVWETMKHLGRKLRRKISEPSQPFGGNGDSNSNFQNSAGGKYILPCLLAIFLFSIVLSFATLTTKPKLWVDEAKSIEMADNFLTAGKLDIEIAPGVFTGIPQILQSTGYPVTVPLAGFFKIFGYGVAQARVYMILWMLAALAAVFWVGKKFFGGRNALLAVLLVATFASFYDNARTVVGEIPGFLLMLAGLYYWLKDESYFLSGIFLGLAVVAKPSVYLSIIPTTVIVLTIGRKGFFKKIFRLGLGMIPAAILWFVLVLPNIFSGSAFKSIADFYRNPFGSSAGGNIAANLLNFFHSTTLIYFGALALAIISARYFAKGERLKTLYNFAICYGILAFIYYLKSPGWLRYIIAGELLVLFLLPQSLQIIFEKAGERWLAFGEKARAGRLAVACVLFLAFIQIVQLFTVADIYYSDSDLRAGAYVAEKFPNKSIAIIDSLNLAIFVSKEKRYLALDDTVIPVSANSLFKNQSPFFAKPLPEIAVIPNGKKITAEEQAVLAKNYKQEPAFGALNFYSLKSAN